MIEISEKIASLVRQEGGTAYYVGGCVRDRLRNVESKDIDIEIHGLSPETVENILDSLGHRRSMGESFGIYSLDGYDVDIALPRKEKCCGRGHRDFDVLVDPFIGEEKAAIRRDFTINALYENILTGEILDFFGGREDIEKGVIRHINDETFSEDPLRVLRGCQFAARFNYTIAPETVALCSKMHLEALAKERIMGESEKALLKADRPSIFFTALKEMGQLSYWFPEVEGLIGIEQNPRFHAEGDVFNHTMLVLDECVKFREKAAYPLGFMFSALCHDFGKAVATEVVKGEIHAYGHEFMGLDLTENFMSRLTSNKKLKEYVLNLSKYHMKPNAMILAGSKIKSTNKLFDKAIDPEGLIYLATADAAGSISKEKKESLLAPLFERYEIYKEYMARPFVTGKDLIRAGVEPGEKFSELLEEAHSLRLAGVNKKAALRMVLGMAQM